MKRLLLAVALTAALLGLTAAPALAGSPTATTYHGKFTSATGMHKTLIGLQSIGASGTWNVIVGSQATQITGHAFAHHFHTDIVPLTENSPVGLHTGTWLITWTDMAWSHGVLTAHGTCTLEAFLPGKSVGLTFTLDPTAATPVRLHVDLSTNYVSEANWLYWDIYGDLTR
jgi:hypothetical protein